MAFTIAVAGKGGVGKTTVAGLIVRELVERGDGPVLAIDADPNTNFHQVLGLTVERTIGELREETLQRIKDLPPGVTKDQYLEYGLQQCLVESNGIDLLAMGRGEGPFCYCAVNHVLRRYIDILSKNYKYVVLDNEAGLEHLSRRTTQDVDVLLVISDVTPVALQAAARINRLADELQLRIHKRFLVLNHVSDGAPSERVMDKIAQVGLSFVGEIPKDEALLHLSFEGRPLSELPPTSSAKLAVKEILEKVERPLPQPLPDTERGTPPSLKGAGGLGLGPGERSQKGGP